MQKDKFLMEIVMKIIKNAHRAPSAGHTQVQEFVIVKNPTIKKKLRKATVNQGYVEQVSVFNCSMF